MVDTSVIEQRNTQGGGTKVTLPCKEWAGAKDKDGYGTCWHEGLKTRAHRVAYCQANGLKLSDIAGKVVRHKCDNRGCIEATHLETGTHAQNVQDRVERGRSAKKLTDAQVEEIRAHYVRGSRETGLEALSIKYGVSQMQISRIVNRTRRQSV